MQEATLGRSAATVAARAAGFDWPVLLPVNDPTRDSYEGFVFRPVSGRILPLQADTRSGSYSTSVFNIKGRFRGGMG